MNVALVHDWLTGMRGGERCLEVFCELFPEAPLFTLLHVPGSVSPVIERRRVITSFIQRLPGAASRYRQYLPLFPAAVHGFDLSGFDLVISLSHSVAKAVRRPADALHICYCFSPRRYVWDLYDDYFGPPAPRPARGCSSWAGVPTRKSPTSTRAAAGCSSPRWRITASCRWRRRRRGGRPSPSAAAARSRRWWTSTPRMRRRPPCSSPSRR